MSLPPPLNLRTNECIILIALSSETASTRYESIRKVLAPLNMRFIEAVNPLVIASLTTNNPQSIGTRLLPYLDRKDIAFIIYDTDEQLAIQVVIHRAVDDKEIRERVDFWKPTWMK